MERRLESEEIGVENAVCQYYVSLVSIRVRGSCQVRISEALASLLFIVQARIFHGVPFLAGKHLKTGITIDSQ